MTFARITTSDDSATLNRARVHVPSWGAWWADVDVTAPLSVVAGATVTIQLADVTLVGAVVSGGAANGRAAYRVIGGAGGWRDTVAAASYFESSGVKVAIVLTDLATRVGETLGVLPATRVTSHYARSVGPASRVLHDLFPRAWHVDFAGVTQLAVRAATTYTGAAARVDVRPGNTVEIVTDEIAALVPGVTVDDLEPATDVEYVLTASRLSARVHGGPRTSRDLDAFRRVLDALDPLRAYRAVYEFRVVTQTGNTLNLQPVRAASGLPDLEQVQVRLPPGVRAGHFLGSLVTVAFLDGDPSRPRVITGDDADAPGWSPLTLEVEAVTSIDVDSPAITIGATATSTDLGTTPRLGVARVGDAVLAGPWAGVITTSSVTVKAGL